MDTKMRSPKAQHVVPVAQAATNSGTKTAPFLAFPRGGSVDYQGFTKKWEPPAVPGGARVCDRSNGQIINQQPPKTSDIVVKVVNLRVNVPSVRKIWDGLGQRWDGLGTARKTHNRQ